MNIKHKQAWAVIRENDKRIRTEDIYDHKDVILKKGETLVPIIISVMTPEEK